MEKNAETAKSDLMAAAAEVKRLVDEMIARQDRLGLPHPGVDKIEAARQRFCAAFGLMTE